MVKFVSTDEIIKEFIEKVREKTSTSDEFTIEHKIDTELRNGNGIVWFSLKTKDYNLYISNALDHIDLYEMERVDEGKELSDDDDNNCSFRDLGRKRADYIENFPDIIEGLIRELNSKYQYVFKKDILKFSNKK